jgi:hypothetical protein
MRFNKIAKVILILIFSLLGLSCSIDDTDKSSPLGPSSNEPLILLDREDSHDPPAWGHQPGFNPVGQGRQKKFKVKEFIDADEGGVVSYGDFEVIIPPNALKKDSKIKMQGSEEDDIWVMKYGPGQKFNLPVIIVISYKKLDLGGINPEDLRIWYFNPETKKWEKVGGTVDLEKKTVSVDVMHFSRFTMAEN